MKQIRLVRPEEKLNKNCRYTILLNGKPVTDLENGESKLIEIPEQSGRPMLQAKIYWCGSRQTQVAELQDTSEVIVTGNDWLNRKLPLMGAMVPLTGIALLSGASEATKIAGTVILGILMIGLIGTLTLWKNRWIELRIHNKENN